ncbi:cytochrome P450 [Sphaerisporangium aureirubrum]|uniref:Cytochrome P450 n=1 Tax=Sphaerisporangium aureirubrum TaxID=1544736 RepID=A0ABW1NP21_9ACTN
MTDTAPGTMPGTAPDTAPGPALGTAPESAAAFDPPELFAEPFPWPRTAFDPPELYAWLRERRPVTKVTTRNGQEAWLVTRYDDVRAVLGDRRISSDIRRPGYPKFGVFPPREEDRPFIWMDPPEHAVFRRLLVKNFLARRVEAYRDRLQALVDGAIDRMTAGERPADLVRALALPVPSTVLAWVLGVREEDQGFFNTATEHLMNRADFTDPHALERAMKAGMELRAYLDQLITEREAAPDPGDDILGQLVAAAREGTIGRNDVVNSGMLMIIAGHETTASMIATGTLVLLRNPGHVAELRADPGLLPGAIEELLRYLTVVHLVVLRVATEDIEIGGQLIRAGEGVIPLNFSANRDDAHYPDADRFDIHRPAKDHFAFGHGIHQCVGQSLARLELRVVWETLLRRIPTLGLAIPAEDVPVKLFSQISGVSVLPVTW